MTAPTGDGIYGYTSYAGIYGTIYTAADAVTISNPTNTTLVNASVTNQFTYTNDQGFAGQCFQASDSTWSNLGIVQAGVLKSREVTGLSIGAHTLNTTCSKHAPYNASVDAPTEEGTGSTTYDLMSNANFTLKNGVTWAGTANAPNGFGNALNFSLDNGGAESTFNPANTSGNFTYGAWFWGNSNCGTGWNCNSTTPRILDTDSINIFLASNSTGTQTCQANNASSSTLSATTTSGFAKKKWNRLDCLFSNNGAVANISIFVNGVYNTSTTSTGFGNLKSTQQKFRIGQGASLARSWDGMVAKVNAFNRTLNATEILGLYNLGVSGYTNATSSISYSRLDWLVNSQTFTSSVYELTKQTYLGSLNYSANIATVVPTFVYNSTNASPNSTSTVGYQNNYTSTRQLSLLQVNNSNASVYWSFNLTWTNGTTIVVNTSTGTQAVLFGYYPSTFVINPSQASEGSLVTSNATMVNNTGSLAIAGVTLSVVTTLNNTSTNATQSGSYFTATHILPAVGVSSVNLTGNATVTINYDSTSRSATWSNAYVLDYMLNLTSCTTGNATLRFDFYDEEGPTNTTLNATMDAAFTIRDPTGTTSHTYNFSWVNQTYAQICIVPGFASGYVDSVQQFYGNYNSTYPTRFYYLANASISNQTTNTTLYLLHQSLGTLVQITVLDTSGAKQSGYTLQATRYYPNLNQYLLLAMAKTDSQGVATLFLRPNDRTHKLYAYSSSVLVQTFNPEVISCTGGVGEGTTCLLQRVLTGLTLDSYTSKTVNVQHSCSYNYTGSYFSCSWSDPSASMKVARLRVWDNAAFQSVWICDNTSTSTTGTMLCPTENATGHDFQAVLSVGFSPEIVVESIRAGIPGAPFASQPMVGVLAGLFLTLTAVGLGLWNAPVAMIYGFFGIALSVQIGFLQISWGAVTLLGIAVIIVFIKTK